MALDIKKFGQLRQTAWVGSSFSHFKSIGSTNTYLKEQFAAGKAKSGMVAFTDHQSAGRGRLGRTWVAPHGSSLLVSVLFRPKFPPQQATWLTMISGLAAIAAVKQVAGLDLALKWPNDVMAQGADGIWRKTGGILLEAEMGADTIEYAIIGMGLNVNIAADALPDAVTPPTSLLAETGSMIDREALLAAWLKRLEELVDSAELGNSPQPAWNEKLITLNQPVTVSGALSISGMAVGTDAWGSLLVKDANGTIHTLTAGDVSLRASA